jgi:hypothetical protein
MEAAAPPSAVATSEYVCVFCGSKEGQTPAFASAAKGLGLTLLQRGLGLVYGGGTVGLMGILSRTVRSPPPGLALACFLLVPACLPALAECEWGGGGGASRRCTRAEARYWG